jgi:flavodoxin
MYGNTEKVAKEIFAVVSQKGKAKIEKAENVNPSDLKSIKLLIVGTPTHGGRPTTGIQEFLENIPLGVFKNLKFAAFDTRFLESDLGFILKRIVRTFGYAAPKISESLRSKGATEIAAPEGFIVVEKEGPLKDGELLRVRKWAETVLE